MSVAPSRGVFALLKRGWNEIPAIIGSSFMALIGIGIAGLNVYTYYKNDGDNRKYKEYYTVIRHDDPRAAKVHKD